VLLLAYEKPLLKKKIVNEAGFGPGATSAPKKPARLGPQMTYKTAKQLLLQQFQGNEDSTPAAAAQTNAAFDFAKKKMGPEWVSKAASLMAEIRDMANYGGPNDPHEQRLIKQLMDLWKQF